MNVDKLVPEGVEGRVAYKGSAVWVIQQLMAACARAWATPAALARRDAQKANSSRSRSRHPRIARARRADRQGGAELPGRVGADARRILILDFGAQYTQLIARRVREAKVYCEIHPCDVDDAFVREFGAKGVILSGSHLPPTTSDGQAPRAVFELGVPVLGICYGMQTMAQQLGGKVEPGKVREFGFAEVRARGHTQLLDGIEDSARRRPRHAQGLDEPRRQGRRDAAGFS
jgi:GMP synthase (glutamine-hydrolysing) A subunit